MTSTFSIQDVVTEHLPKPPFITIHGDPGTGKTYFGAKIPNHIIIRTEDGLGTLQASAFPKCKSFMDVMQQIEALIIDDHDYGVLVIDTLSAFEDLLHEQAVLDWNEDGSRKPKNIRLITDPGFNEGPKSAMGLWKYFIGKIEQLQEERGMAVILMAHSQEKSKVDPLNPAFKKIGIKVSSGPASLLVQECDLIGYMHIKTSIIKEDTGFGGQNVRASTSGMRVLQVDVHPAYEAKNRYGISSEVTATWEGLMDAIQKASPEE